MMAADSHTSPLSLVRELERGIHDLSVPRAETLIEAWKTRLAAIDEPQLHQIARELDALATQLSRSPQDPVSLGGALARVGDLCLSASPLAEDPAQRLAVERLGHLLFHAGHALRGPIPSPNDTSLSPS